MTELCETPVKVMFQHCDPAGIVFYPRYFEMLNAVIEDWFEAVIGVSFAEQSRRGIGVPSARVAMEFLKPSRLGDTLTFTLRLERLGRSAMDLGFTAAAADGVRLTGTITIVHVARDVVKPTPWSPDIRARVEQLIRGAA